MLLSIVIPCYNEEAVLEETHRRLVGTLERAAGAGSRLLVDDGSRDATGSILRRLHEQDSRVRVLRFSRNFGHQVAVSAGLEHVIGDAVVIIDADLQDPPRSSARCSPGDARCDVAYGLRINGRRNVVQARYGEAFLRSAQSAQRHDDSAGRR